MHIKSAFVVTIVCQNTLFWWRRSLLSKAVLTLRRLSSAFVCSLVDAGNFPSRRIIDYELARLTIGKAMKVLLYSLLVCLALAEAVASEVTNTPPRPHGKLDAGLRDYIQYYASAL